MSVQSVPENKKSSGRFLSGVAVLTVSTVIVKLIGLLYKIPMIKVLGEEGMGYFNSAYELYSLFFIIATAGIPVAISIMISKSLERGREKNIKKIFNVILALFFLLGMMGTLVLYYGAPIFAGFLENTNAAACIAAIAPMAIFICISSAIRGFFQGHQNMVHTAVSQIIEALGKLFLGLALAVWAIKEGYAVTEAAAFATGGIVAGVGLSMLYLILVKAIFKRRGEAIDQSEQVDSSKTILSTLLAIAVPITLSATVMSITRVIDLVMIMKRLQAIGYTEGAANIVYGAYSTLGLPMFNLPGAFVTPIALSLVPVITSALQAGDRKREKRVLNSALRLCGLIALPASFGLCVFARPILELLFAGETSAIKISAPLLSILGISVFFSCLMTVTNSVLQAYGQERKPIISMLAGAIIKVIASYILIGIPAVNIKGAPISTFLCTLSASAINFIFIKKATDALDDAVKLFARSLLASAISIGLCGVGYYTTVAIIGKSYGATILFVALATVLYAVISLKIKAVNADEILLLPMGDKLHKILRKVKLI